jgi:dienelactone hydrolase
MRRRFLALAVVLALAAVAGPARGQWQGTGRAQGVVLDEHGKPVQGARVTLVGDDTEGTGPPPATTDKKGRWAFLGLAGGRWKLTIEAEGYLTSSGSIQVPDEGPAQLTKVELRPLKEVSPMGAEGGAATVRGWLEKGNTLLEQGKYPEARAEYAKAINALPPAEHPKVLSSVARAYYLEGQPEKAEKALKHALYDVPGDAASRQLLTALMEGGGKGDEVREWLARLDRDGPDFIAEELGFNADTPALEGGEGGGAAPAELPVEAPVAQRVGRYRTAFSERSPLSGIDTFLDRFDLDRSAIAAADPAAGAYDLAAETYEVFVPDTYRPGEKAGLLVWVSPGASGAIHNPDLLKVLAERRMIWIGANNSGNTRPRWTRMGLALDAVHNMKRLYDLDESRIYVIGYSGGGRTASALAMVYPEAFDGAFCVYGVDFYRAVAVPDKPGAHWPPAYPPPPRSEARRVKQEHRYVLLTGELDFNRAQTKVYYGELVDDGFAHVTYLEIPGASHYSGIGGEWFARGLAALDAPLAGGSGAPG